ncbi:MAG: hypothetical protein HKO96_08350 [Flavobacteriaceae bacterium]|nr:energy transducer TonB [Bacteroidia bacterium]NNK70474.1 hypothetical protein [Flavobacteriaceae bacterium]
MSAFNFRNKEKSSNQGNKNPKPNTTLYFQIGLILSLTMVYALFEMQFEFKSPELSDQGLSYEPEYFIYPPELKAETPEYPEEDKPLEKKKANDNFKLIDDDASLKKMADTLFSKPVKPDGPAIDPGDIVLPEDPRDAVYNIVTVEHVPVYPGCEKMETNQDRLACMSDKLGQLVKRKFNTDLASELNSDKPHKIILYFTIDSGGEIKNLIARTPYPRLQKEALKVGYKIPVMQPGRQGDKNVSVMYALPIVVAKQY